MKWTCLTSAIKYDFCNVPTNKPINQRSQRHAISPQKIALGISSCWFEFFSNWSWSWSVHSISHSAFFFSFSCIAHGWSFRSGGGWSVQVVVESGVCRRLVQLIDHPSSHVVKPALRTIGNVVCAEDDADYTEDILEAGSVVCLKRLIAHPNREIQKEVGRGLCLFLFLVLLLVTLLLLLLLLLSLLLLLLLQQPCRRAVLV